MNFLNFGFNPFIGSFHMVFVFIIFTTIEREDKKYEIYFIIVT
jgi:hypothetical protein